MKKNLALAIVFIVTIMGAAEVSAAESVCKSSDTICKKFETLAQEERFETIIKMVDPAMKYSEGSRRYIGEAYLALASAESNTPEQEEAFCRKALEFGARQAAMGLYFIYAQRDEEKALGFLKEYVASKPSDSVPYVILGESEIKKKNYALADDYLRKSKKAARAYSPRVDWLLFQVNYLLGNYSFAGEMFESAVRSGQFRREMKNLASDVRFKGMESHPEFKKYEQLLKETNGQ